MVKYIYERTQESNTTVQDDDLKADNIFEAPEITEYNEADQRPNCLGFKSGVPYYHNGTKMVPFGGGGDEDPVNAQASDQVDGIYTLIWDADKKNRYGSYGRFQVEMSNSYQTVPITILKDGSGKPTSYQFQLDGIDSLIHII